MGWRKRRNRLIRFELNQSKAIRQKTQLESMTQKKILIVEDNKDLLELIGKYLRGSGWEVALAHGTRECWDRLTQVRPSVVLLDMLLSEDSGFEIARRLKREHAYRQIPIVAMTGLSSRHNVQRCFEAGCRAILLKPFRFTALDKILTELVDPPRPPVGSAASDS